MRCNLDLIGGVVNERGELYGLHLVFLQQDFQIGLLLRDTALHLVAQVLELLLPRLRDV